MTKELFRTPFYLFIILFFGGCSQADQQVNQTEECKLKSIDEEYLRNASGLKDFTITNISELNQDSLGTEWNNETKDTYRFVIKENNETEILVYKNDVLFKEVKNLKVKSKRHVPVDRSKCDLDILKEYIHVDWFLESKTKPNPNAKGSSVASTLYLQKGGNPVAETILEVDKRTESCSCLVVFHIDSKRKIKGEFKLYPKDGQNCAE